MAIVLDVLSPQLDKLAHTFTGRDFGSGIRITALCLSGCSRALCGIVAGGSKAAVTMHFASDSLVGSGDIGDLNAKDSSKETVLALVGLLVRTRVVPRRRNEITSSPAWIRDLAIRKHNWGDSYTPCNPDLGTSGRQFYRRARALHEDPEQAACVYSLVEFQGIGAWFVRSSDPFAPPRSITEIVGMNR